MVVAQRVPPGSQGLPVVGELLSLQRQGVFGFYLNGVRKYGDISGYKVGPLKSFAFARSEHIQHIMVKHPETYVKAISHEKLRFAIGNGILTLEGPKWVRQRKLMQPLYTPKGIRQFTDIMLEESGKLGAYWRDTLPTNAVVDVNKEMARATMAVIGRSMFGQIPENDEGRVADAILALLHYTGVAGNSLIDIPLFVPTRINQIYKRSRRIVADYIYNLIRQKRESGLGDDLLSMLMTSKDADTGEFMTDEQLHDEALITLFAGHETTASLLTWTWYLLDKHPEVEAKLHAELDSVLGGRTPTPEDLPNLPYTRMVLDEVLRLYAPVTMIARDTVQDDEIDGYAIPKGSLIVVMFYATHRYPDYWEKPLEFYPEHFTEAAVAARPRYAYVPFGAGHRVCLGVHFGQMEAALILADLAQRFRLRMATPNDGDIVWAGVTRPKAPILMRVERRG